MVMRYAHHHPESLRAGVEILDRVPTEVSTNLAQSASHKSADVGTETAVSGLREEKRLVAGKGFSHYLTEPVRILLR